jgi:fluoroquinolone transport system permease protein
MINLLKQLKWQTFLLYKNKVITISLIVTGFYAVVFYLFRDYEFMDKLLVTLLLNDSAIIGFLFIGLGIIIEKRSQVLAAISVSPINHHLYVTTKVLSLSLLGSLCTLGLACAAVGFNFNFLDMLFGSFIICMITTLMGVILVSFTFDFLKFSLYSLPLILLFVNVPLLDYLGVLDLGYFKYISPIQPSLDILISSLTESQEMVPVVSLAIEYALSILWLVFIYAIAYRLFNTRVLNV